MLLCKLWYYGVVGVTFALKNNFCVLQLPKPASEDDGTDARKKNRGTDHYNEHLRREVRVELTLCTYVCTYMPSLYGLKCVPT